MIFAPITLHTGLSSQDAGEVQPEWFEVSETTAHLVNSSRARGGRVIAVGTTATRAIESVARPDGIVAAASGWTDLVISPERPVRVVDGLITGWHNPEASHLLVESVAGAELTQRAYDAAVAEHYLWHEFGDSCSFFEVARALSICSLARCDVRWCRRHSCHLLLQEREALFPLLAERKRSPSPPLHRSAARAPRA